MMLHPDASPSYVGLTNKGFKNTPFPFFAYVEPNK